MKNQRFGLYTITIHAALVAFCLLVLMLTRENGRLKEGLYQASLAAVAGPEVDERLPEVPVIDLDGIESVLHFDGQAQDSVVLVFTTTCPACKGNLASWRDLYEHHGDRYRFVAVGLDEPEATRQYAAQNELPFPVVIPADRPSFQQAYSISSVPQTLVVGADGRVKSVRPGILPAGYAENLG